MKRLLILPFILLCSCGNSAQEIKAENETNLESPEYIGKLKDGRKLYRVEIANRFRSDRVYFLDGKSVNTNYEVKEGKSSHVEAVGVIE